MSSFQSIPIGERPQERLHAKGPGALSDAELLAVVLRSGTRGWDVMRLSHKVLLESGSLRGLLRLTAEDLQQYPGIGRVKALQLLATIEIARRILTSGEASPLMDNPQRIYEWLRPMADGEAVERLRFRSPREELFREGDPIPPESLPEMRLRSRYPYGLTDGQLSTLLAHEGRTAVEELR